MVITFNNNIEDEGLTVCGFQPDVSFNILSSYCGYNIEQEEFTANHQCSFNTYRILETLRILNLD